MQNILSLNHGNPVAWSFTADGGFTLNDFDEIVVRLGDSDQWSTVETPNELFVEDEGATLKLKVNGAFTITESTVPEIVGFNIDYPQPYGKLLNHPQRDECGEVKLIL